MNFLAGNPFIKQDKNEFFFEEVNFIDLDVNTKTPYFIFLENRIRENIKMFNQMFSSHFNKYQGFYSFKANYLLEICKIIKEEGFGAEIISLPELELALKLKFPPDKIIAGGPYLTDELISKCIENKIREIVVYNIHDLERINEIANNLNITQKICLRINSGKYDARLGLNISEITIKDMTRIFSNCKNLELTTVLSHFSTQMNSIELLKKNCISLLDTLIEIQNNLGIEIKNINFGGGFPEAVVFKKERIEEYALTIKKLLDEYKTSHSTVYFEPGRYIIGDAGLLISKVIYTQNDGWIFLNVGNHIVPKFARCTLRFYNLSNVKETYNKKTSIAGIVPTDQDVLAKDYFFTPSVNIGDKVLIANVGAYCLTFSNRFPYTLPEIFLINGNKYKKIFNPIEQHDFSI